MNVQHIVKQAGLMWQHKREFEALLSFMIDRNIKSVLELGTGFGGSAFCFGEVTGHGRIVSIDFGQAGAARIDPARRRKQPNPNFVQINGDSRTAEVEKEAAAYGPFDMVWFDTEHPFEDCMDNYNRYGKMAQNYIAQHDINMDEEKWPGAGLPRFYREVLAPLGVLEEFLYPDPDPRFPRWGGIGIVRAPYGGLYA